jgi:hypothetical protein
MIVGRPAVTTTADLTVPERVLLFCVDTEWQKAGITGATTTIALTKQGRAALTSLVRRGVAPEDLSFCLASVPDGRPAAVALYPLAASLLAFPDRFGMRQ